jgi:GntR family transcriptional regulator
MGLATDDPRTRAVQAADALRKDIGPDQRYKPGAKLPSIRELSESFGIAAETAKRALTILKEEGWIYSVPNRGYFVTDSADRGVVAASPTEALLLKMDSLQSELRDLAARVAELEKRSDSGGS